MPTTPVQKAILPLDFTIVGAGVAGLASAITLTRAGHRVQLLEKADGIIERGRFSAIRIPPNMFRLLRRWGMESEIKAVSVRTQSIKILRFESGELLGDHRWGEEVFEEAQGEFHFMMCSDLLSVMHKRGVEQGAEFRTNAEVVSYNIQKGQKPSVTLASGEIIESDVIIAADGIRSIARTAIRGKSEDDVRIGIMSYSLTVPASAMLNDPELATMIEDTETMWHWLGNKINVMGHALINSTHELRYCVNICAPETGNEPDWIKSAGSETLAQLLGECDSRLQKLAGLATLVSWFPALERPSLEDWVHPDGGLLIIGDAAHPYPRGLYQSCAVPNGDAGVLGQLFQHSMRPDQTQNFLWAVQDIRQKRVEEIRKMELANMFALSMLVGAVPNDPAQAHAIDSDVVKQWEVDKTIYGYDAEDEAEDWWVKWGLLNERAGNKTSGEGPMSIDIEVVKETAV